MTIALTIFMLIMAAIICCVYVSFVIPIRKENRRIKKERDFYSHIHIGADGQMEQNFYSYDNR